LRKSSRQLGDIRRDPPRLILAEQLGGRSAPQPNGRDDVRQIGGNLATELEPFFLANIALI
jgi:hypothetical protein